MSEVQSDENGVWHERYARWQEITLRQTTYAIDLILGFAGAAIGFEITLALNDNFKLPQWASPVYTLSLVTLGISMFFGLSAVVSRLHDFRVTRRIAFLSREPQRNAEQLARKRGVDELLGGVSWRLFYAQLGAFALGVLLAVIALFPFAAARAS